MPNRSGPFTLHDLQAAAPPAGRLALTLVRPLAERLLSLSPLQSAYQQILSEKKFNDSVGFLAETHRLLNVNYDVSDESLERIPETGPLIIVANHPYGGIEATMLLRILARKRPDVKFMANFLLDRIPETRDFCFYVDPFGGENSPKNNLQPLREIIEWVKQGGALCIFPSGTVSHFDWRLREVTDPEWSPTVGRIVRKAKAPVLPVFFSGRNGLFFQSVGLIHPLLRTALLAREFYNKRNKTIRARIGNPIKYDRLKEYRSDDELISYLRFRTYLLRNGNEKELALDEIRKSSFPTRKQKLAPIVPAVEPKLLIQDINALPSNQILIDSGDNIVAYARAKQIPHILREIGRLREISFRHAHEGTGKSIDLDRFDSFYTHLFIWNRKANELVGAYRLVKTDRVLRHFGNSGLYTSTLFAYREPLLEQLGPALELGRSFVRQEYQRSYSSLLLLWKGIAHYVLKNPRYHVLFGPVSINSEYDSLSRQLIANFLKGTNYLPELARLIKPRNPLKNTRIPGVDFQTKSVVAKDLAEISELLREMESTQDSVPVLLRQYLKLGGKLLGFNVDPSFGDVLDGLIYVDLLETDTRLLERYMGREGIEEFLQFHGRELPSLEKTGT